MHPSGSVRFHHTWVRPRPGPPWGTSAQRLHPASELSPSGATAVSQLLCWPWPKLGGPATQISPLNETGRQRGSPAVLMRCRARCRGVATGPTPRIVRRRPSSLGDALGQDFCRARGNDLQLIRPPRAAVRVTPLSCVAWSLGCPVASLRSLRSGHVTWFVLPDFAWMAEGAGGQYLVRTRCLLAHALVGAPGTQRTRCDSGAAPALSSRTRSFGALPAGR